MSVIPIKITTGDSPQLPAARPFNQGKGWPGFEVSWRQFNSVFGTPWGYSQATASIGAASGGPNADWPQTQSKQD